MRKLTLSFIVFFVLCTVVRGQIFEPIASIGSQVKNETVETWAQHYQATHPSEVIAYQFGAGIFSEMLASKNVAGVYVYYSIDDKGVLTLLLTTSDHKGAIAPGGEFYGNGKPVFAKTSSGNPVSFGTTLTHAKARTMIEAYRAARKDKINSHLYGKDIFLRLLAQRDVAGVEFNFGIDEKGVQQIFFNGVDSNGKMLPSLAYFDKGQSCPPYCDFMQFENQNAAVKR